MKFDDIMSEWEKDAVIDFSNLSKESLQTPQLHSKYLKILMAEGIIFKKVEVEYKSLYKLKYEYYMGIMDKHTLNEKGWEPNVIKILKQDLPIYMESDPELQEVQIKKDVQKQKIDLIESILKTINNRGFLIKNAIDWEKFKQGL